MAGGIDGDDFLARMEAQRREMMQKNDLLTADALHFPGEVQVGAPPAVDGAPGPHRSSKSAQQPASHQESLSSGKRADYSQRFRDLIGSIHDHVGGDEDEGATDAPYFDFELGGWTTSTTAPASSGDEAGAGLSSASTVSASTAKTAARVAASASSFRATGGVPKPTKNPSADRLTRPPLAPQRPPLPKLVAEQAKEVIPAHRRFSPRTARTLANSRSASSTASSSRPDFDVGVGAAASKPEHDMDDCGLTAQDRMDLQEIRDIASGKQQLPPPAFYAIDKATPNYRTPLTLDQAVQSMAAASSDSDSNRLQLDRNGGFDFERVVNSRRAGFTTLTPAEEAVLFDCLPRSCFSGQRVGGRALAADENVKQLRLEKVQKSEREVTVTTHASAGTGTRAVPEDHDASASSPFATPSAETSRSGSKSSCRSTGVSSSAPGSAMTTSSSSRCAKNSAKDEFLACLRSLRRAEKGSGSVILNLRVLARAFRKVIQNPECAKYRRLDAAKLRRAVFGSRTEVTSQAHSTVTADHFQYDLLDCLLECVGWRFLPAVADNHTDKKGIKSVGDAVEIEKLPSGDRFVFPLRKRGTDAGDNTNTYTKLSTLRMAVQFLEVLLDGHHDPSTLFPTESSGGTAINENGFATATLRGLCGAVENRLRAVLGEAAEKIQLSDIGSRLAASGLGVNVRHAVRMWVQGSWPSFAITLAAGEDCGLRGSTASEGNGAPSSELEKLLNETDSALATATSKSKKMMDKSSHNSSSSSSQLVDKIATAWNAAFAKILCSTWDYADAAVSRCLTRIRWEILRLALNEHEHDGRRDSLFDLASVVPQVNATATSTGGARFSSSFSDADELQNSRAEWAESLLARAAKTMGHLDLMKMPDENVDEAGTHEPLFAGVEEDQDGRGLSSSPSARPEQEQNQEREGGPRPPRTLSPIEHALRVLRLTECPQTLASLKGAYRSRCLQCHPDKGGSKEAFHELHAAFVTLRDVVVPLVPSSSPRPPRTAAAQDEQTKHAHSEEAHPEDGDAAAQTAASKASRSRPPSEEPTTLLVSRLADLASFLESICVAVNRGAAENVSHTVSLGRVMLEAVDDFVTLLRVVSERLLEQSTDVLGEQHGIGTTSTTTCYATVAREIAFEAAASHRAADIVSEMARSAGETLAEAEKFVEHVRQADQPHQEEEVADLRVEIGHLLAQSASRLRSCVAHAEGRCQAAASLVLKIDEAREARAARTHTTEGHEEGATVKGGGGAGDLLLAYVRRFSRQQWQQAERDELQHLIRATGVHDEELFRVLAETTASCRESCGNTSKEAIADLVEEFPNILVDLRHRRALVDHLLGLDKTRTLEILAG